MSLVIKTPVIVDDRIIVSYYYNQITYKHEFIAPIDIPIDDQNVKVLVQWLAIIHALYLFSIEYFEEIETEFNISDKEIAFFEKVIYNGMAEFRYCNKIPLAIKTKITSLSAINEKDVYTSKELNGRLLLNGGGKDGLASAYLMNEAQIDFDLFQIGTGTAQARAAKILNKKPYIFKRNMDSRRYEQKYSGHKPTSAAIAIAATLCAYLLGKNEVISSNENSANEPNANIDSISINHQYSKTYEFENDFSELLIQKKIPIKYFSLLRPLQELQIIKIFANESKYHMSFVSCNHGQRKGYWCMQCAKCAFINLAFTAILPTSTEKIFKVKDSINLPALYDHIAALIDSHIPKPFECVGNLLECQIAAKLIIDNPDVKLSKELQKLFIENTKDITDEIIRKNITSLQSTNNVPIPEYNNLLRIMQDKLNV